MPQFINMGDDLMTNVKKTLRASLVILGLWSQVAHASLPDSFCEDSCNTLCTKAVIPFFGYSILAMFTATAWAQELLGLTPTEEEMRSSRRTYHLSDTFGNLTPQTLERPLCSSAEESKRYTLHQMYSFGEYHLLPGYMSKYFNIKSDVDLMDFGVPFNHVEAAWKDTTCLIYILEYKRATIGEIVDPHNHRKSDMDRYIRAKYPAPTKDHTD